MVLQCYYNCLELNDNGITMILQLPGTDWQWYYNVITIAWNWLTMILQCYYNCLDLIDNGITILLQLPGTDWQWYYNVITIAWNWLIILLQCYYNCLELIDNDITMILQLPGIDWQWYYNSIDNDITMPFKMNTIIVVNGCGIIHIAYRVHALSIVIKMLATPRSGLCNA